METPLGNWPGDITGTLIPDRGLTYQSRTPLYRVGSRYKEGDRVFRYSRVMASQADGLLRGEVGVSFNSGGIERGDKLGAMFVGDYRVRWEVQSNTIEKNQFKDGYILIEGGFCKAIESSPVATKGMNMQLILKEKLTEAQDAGRYGILVEGLYSNVVVRSDRYKGPELAVGVPLIDVTKGWYVWLQTWGPCAVTGKAGTPTLPDERSGVVPGIDNNSEMLVSVLPGVEMDAGGGAEEQVIGFHIPYRTLNWDNRGYRLLFLRLSP